MDELAHAGGRTIMIDGADRRRSNQAFDGVVRFYNTTTELYAARLYNEGMLRHKSIRPEAIVLRKQGLMYSEIATKLNVPRGTVYSWLKDLSLTASEAELVRQRHLASQRRKVVLLAEQKRSLTRAKNELLRNQASEIVAKATWTMDSRKVLCAALFWCEGGKADGQGVHFINSDPMLVRTFLSLFRECFPIDESRLRALLHLHDYHDVRAQHAYWSEITSIPVTNFYKYYLKPHTARRKHQDYQGCISLRYNDVRLGKLLKMIYSEFGKNF